MDMFSLIAKMKFPLKLLDYFVLPNVLFVCYIDCRCSRIAMMKCLCRVVHNASISAGYFWILMTLL